MIDNFSIALTHGLPVEDLRTRVRCRHEQQFIGERIEQSAEVGDEVSFTRQLPVPIVGNRGDKKQTECDEPRRPRRHER